MNILKTYQRDAARTVAMLGDIRLDLSHMILGITSEIEEYLEAVIKDDTINENEELSDMAWYIANYCDMRSYSFEEIVVASSSYSDEEYVQDSGIIIPLTRLADYVKKYIAYNKEIDRSLEKNALLGIAKWLIEDNPDFDLERDLTRNINKLKQRYPERFTEEDALNRDLDSERKILEGNEY